LHSTLPWAAQWSLSSGCSGRPWAPANNTNRAAGGGGGSEQRDEAVLGHMIPTRTRGRGTRENRNVQSVGKRNKNSLLRPWSGCGPVKDVVCQSFCIDDEVLMARRSAAVIGVALLNLCLHEVRCSRIQRPKLVHTGNTLAPDVRSFAAQKPVRKRRPEQHREQRPQLACLDCDWLRRTYSGGEPCPRCRQGGGSITAVVTTF
jgi:hypothetical protein